MLKFELLSARVAARIAYSNFQATSRVTVLDPAFGDIVIAILTSIDPARFFTAALCRVAISLVMAIPTRLRLNAFYRGSSVSSSYLSIRFRWQAHLEIR